MSQNDNQRPRPSHNDSPQNSLFSASASRRAINSDKPRTLRSGTDGLLNDSSDTVLSKQQAADYGKVRGKPLRLSPTSGLNLYNDCPRCFWLHYNGQVPRPRGIFPSLPGGMDLVIKNYFDEYRGSLPPELRGRIKGDLLNDINLMNRWRNWRTGLEYFDKKRNAVLFGALDECLVHEGKYVPLDYKTRGSAPNDGDSERYYQTQLDAYALMLEANGYPVADFAYLIYYYPEQVGEHGAVRFNVHPVELSLDVNRAKNTFEKAVDSLQKPLPNHQQNCEYCSWHKNMGALSL